VIVQVIQNQLRYGKNITNKLRKLLKTFELPVPGRKLCIFFYDRPEPMETLNRLCCDDIRNNEIHGNLVTFSRIRIQELGLLLKIFFEMALLLSESMSRNQNHSN